MSRCIASKTIERQRAIKNTALKNAPKISARNHYHMSAQVRTSVYDGCTDSEGIFVC